MNAMCGIDQSDPTSHPAATPLGLWGFAAALPRVARSSQPWAGGRNPFGIGWPTAACRWIRILSSLDQSRISKVSNSRPLGRRSLRRPAPLVSTAASVWRTISLKSPKWSRSATGRIESPLNFGPPAQDWRARVGLGYPATPLTTQMGFQPIPIGDYLSFGFVPATHFPASSASTRGIVN